jgi:hypothetical protein
VTNIPVVLECRVLDLLNIVVMANALMASNEIIFSIYRPRFATGLRWYNMYMLELLCTKNIGMSSSQAGSIGNFAIHLICKGALYEELSLHFFQSTAFESTDVFGQDALDFFRKLSGRSRSFFKDPFSYLNLSTKQVFAYKHTENAVSVKTVVTFEPL